MADYYRPDIFLMVAFSSSSVQSAQVPFGGMLLMPVMALARMPSRPPWWSARSFQAAVSPIFGAPSVFATFVMRQFFIALPVELEEAARVDGLSRFGIFWQIALPLAKPALAAVAIFTFLHSWNLYLEPIVFLTTPGNFTLPQALTQYVDVYQGPMWNTQLAAATLTALPVLVVFIFAQRQFIEGLAHTGLKG